MTPVQIGIRVAQARDGLRMSQEELSQKSGISRTTISKIECGRLKSMSTKTVLALASALRVSAGYLLCG